MINHSQFNQPISFNQINAPMIAMANKQLGFVVSTNDWLVGWRKNRNRFPSLKWKINGRTNCRYNEYESAFFPILVSRCQSSIIIANTCKWMLDWNAIASARVVFVRSWHSTLSKKYRPINTENASFSSKSTLK